jgi:mannose-1-phosphate guanylyltransferase
MSINKGILLVGGKGTRLAPLTDNTPKPMLKVAGKPVTEHQIIKARESGITDLVLATSYMAEVFEPYFGDGSRFGVSITYAVESEPLGTGGAIANAAQYLDLTDDESIAVFNGDVLSAHNLANQIKLHEGLNSDVTLFLTKVDDPRAYGCVPIDADQKVLSFLEKMENPVADTINAGCYIFRKSALNQIPVGVVVSVERDTFPRLLSDGFNLYGYLDTSYWIDMGTPHSFIKASRDLLLNPELSAATQGVYQGSLIGQRAEIHSSAKVGDGSVIGDEVRISENVMISGSMISDGVFIGAGAVIRNSYVAKDRVIAANSELDGVVIG